MDSFVLGDQCVFPAEPDRIHRNLNTMIIGGSGSGKTFSIVEPTLQRTSENSLVISDPKGTLVRKYAEYFRRKGYKVKILDFIHPEESACGFDPLQMIQYSDQNVLSVAHMLLYDSKSDNSIADPFWNQMAEVLLSSIISYVMERGTSTITQVQELAGELIPQSDDDESGFGIGKLADIMRKEQEICNRNRRRDPFYLRQWKRVHVGAEKTISSIYIMLQALLGRLDSNEMLTFFAKEEQVDARELLHRKTVVFVKCSDVDPSLFFFINTFYMVLMKELFRICDMSDDRATIPVRFILDDFAATVAIQDLPLWISTMRERKISVTMILQSITQLESIYGPHDSRTIIANCDNIVYLHSNDFDTAAEFAQRIGTSVRDLLYLPIDEEYVIVSGQEPIRTKRYDMRNDDEYLKIKALN